MKINLRNFPDEGRDFEGEDPVEILDVSDPEYRFESPVGYRLHGQVLGHALVVTGRVWTHVGVTCVRCLKDSKQAVEVRDFVVHREITSTEDFADLTENLREDILLALPQHPLCSKDCRGLCPVCGQDLNERTCSCAKRAAGPDSKGVDAGSTGTPWSALDRIKIARK
ncbi:MAG: DUF177 domain-containing protein [Verrucomicrobia bacterium]|nr:DUF177 domain-containing protein [Verrucomicrobiota bacterium]